MDTIIYEAIDQILLRNDISILSEIKDAVFYKVGDEIQSVKYNHYDFKALVSHMDQELIKVAIEVNVKPYIILQPRNKAYFRILKASIENNQLKLETILYPKYNFHESEFEIIVIDRDSLKAASEKKILVPDKAPPKPDSEYIACSDILELKRIQEELYAKNQVLENINADLNNFVYASSHDLLVPLSHIEGMINLLDTTDTQDADREIIQMINVAILKFKEIIQELAEVGKVEAEMLAEMKMIDVSELLEEVIMSLKDESMSSHTSIITHIGEREIKFSKKNLRSIMYNLLSNGIKFKSPNRDPQITVSTQASQGSLMLTVQDNGMGIEKSQRSAIFWHTSGYTTT